MKALQLMHNLSGKRFIFKLKEFSQVLNDFINQELNDFINKYEKWIKQQTESEDDKE